MSVKRQLVGSLLVLVLTATGLGCTSTDSTASGAAEIAPSKACFNVRDVQSFEAIHDKYVYVRCRRSRHFLLTMENICLGLRNSLAIAVANDFNRVCSQDRAMITYQGLGRTSRCQILSVEEVESREAARELVDSRTRPPTDSKE